MVTSRRELLVGGPLCLASLLVPTAARAESESLVQVHGEALDFWTRGMGVSPSAIMGAESIKGSGGSKGARGPSSAEAFAQEPIFLHYSERDGSFIPSDQLPGSYLLDSGDAQVTTQLQRLRLNRGDNNRFAKYTSGAIYFEIQQGQPAGAAGNAGGNSGLAESVVQFATSVFSAFAPGAQPAKNSNSNSGSRGSSGSGGNSGSGGGNGSSGGRGNNGGGSTGGSSGGGSSKSGGSYFQAPSGSSGGQAAGAPIPLQTVKQAQSLALPNGLGKAAFSAFVKDPRKTFFGQFFSAMTGSVTGAPLYSQLLTIPLVATPGLASIRSIVANLHTQGNTQDTATILQSPPIDIAATAAALNAVSNPLRLREGDYLMIARDHPGVTLDTLNKYRLVNGFLVPKEIKSDSEVDSSMVTQTLPTLSYLTMSVRIKRTAKGSCLAG